MPCTVSALLVLGAFTGRNVTDAFDVTLEYEDLLLPGSTQNQPIRIARGSSVHTRRRVEFLIHTYPDFHSSCFPQR